MSANNCVPCSTHAGQKRASGPAGNGATTACELVLVPLSEPPRQSV